MSKKKKGTKIQLITLGDHMVGKTSILTRFKDDSFSQSTYTTIGIDFVSKVMNIASKSVRVKIWDTAGQDRFQTITHSFYNQCQGVLFVYDVGSQESFEDISKWLEGVNTNAKTSVIKYLLANKIDIEKREVTKEEGEKKAAEYNMKYFEVSAKSGININEAILSISEEVLKNKGEDIPENGLKIADNKKTGGGCC